MKTLSRNSDDVQLGLLLGLALVFYAAPWSVVYVPVAIGLLYLSWRRLDLALLQVLAFVPAFMQPKHIGTRIFPPSELFLALCLLVALIWLALPEQRQRFRWEAVRHSPFLWPAMVFLAAATISTVLAADRAEAFRAYREIIVEPMLWLALVLMLGTEQGWWRRAFGVLIASGLVIGAIAVGQVITGHDLSTTGSSIRRARALYGSPDNLGLFFDRVVPIWLAVVLALSPVGRWIGARVASGRRSQIQRPVFATWIITGAILLAGLLLSYSRGAWAAIAASACALFALRGWWRPVAAVVIVVGIGAAIVGGPRVVRAFGSGHANSIQQRLYLWQSAVHMIRDHPVVGIGPDNFVHYFAPTRKENLWQRDCLPGLGYIQPAAGAEPCLSHPHNVVLDFWLSTGLLGLAAFVWLQVVFWSHGWVAYTQSSGFQAAMLAGVMAAMLATLLHGLVDNSYFLEDLSLLFWLLCGYVSYVSVSSGIEGASSQLPSGQSTGVVSDPAVPT